MGQVDRYQAHSITGQETDEPTIHYESSSTGMTSHSIVNGKETNVSGGVQRVLTRTPEAGVMIGGISVAPHEAEEFERSIQADYEAAVKAESEREEVEVKGFDESTAFVLDDLDQGDLANAVNLAVKGELDDEKLAASVSSLGFNDRNEATKVGKQLMQSLEKSFEELSAAEGMDMRTAWDAMIKNNSTEANKAIQDWVFTGGLDNERLKQAIHEGLNAYGSIENEALIGVLKADGYEVMRNPSGGLAIRGNSFSDWTNWRDFRKVYMQ